MPEWVEGVKWLFAAFLLAIASVGPIILGPFLKKYKDPVPPPIIPQQPSGLSNQLAVVGGALANKDSLDQLNGTLSRLCDIFEKRYQMELEESEEAKFRKKLQDALERLNRLPMDPKEFP